MVLTEPQAEAAQGVVALTVHRAEVALEVVPIVRQAEVLLHMVVCVVADEAVLEAQEDNI